MRVRFWLGLLALIAPGTAHAAWMQASSAHFVVYANDSERNLRAFSQQLERYHAAMTVITGLTDIAPSASNRVTVYVVGGEREVRKLYGDGGEYIGGFYMPRAGGSLAIVPRVHAGTGSVRDMNFSMVALLHEYAHHFMISASDRPMPRWYSEGGAEFFASASFTSDGGVGIGQPALHRAEELLVPGAARDVKVAELLDPPARDNRRASGYDAFYGKSWLLFHYLTFNKPREGQLVRYLQLLGEGKSSREAGLAAFGDFATLEHELDRYLAGSRMQMLTLRPAMVQTGPIEVHAVSPGEAAMMPVRIRSRRGVNAEQATALLTEARAIAARFPDDPAVLSALAEAEHDAGNDPQAIAAADAAIAKDPGQVNAYVQKGLALFSMADNAPDRETAYLRARAPFLALNRREPDHPLPLVYFYRSYVARGVEPTPLALTGLARAADLAPFDLGLRMTLAMAQLQHRQRADARRNLLPIAYNPHGGGLAQAAQRVLARLDAEPQWDGTGVDALVRGASDDAGG